MIDHLHVTSLNISSKIKNTSIPLKYYHFHFKYGEILVGIVRYIFCLLRMKNKGKKKTFCFDANIIKWKQLIKVNMKIYVGDTVEFRPK